jgi:hypothetical protein
MFFFTWVPPKKPLHLQAKHPLNTYEVDNFLGLMLSHVDLFVYSHIFQHKILKVNNDCLPIFLGV